ncbi:MAG TPA: hybrid sensor histidine kinase/response regulator, partial [Microvirga sp.]|nr:hybrid sensor histidine kinase/response regulator [Microvirga sp.]
LLRQVDHVRLVLSDVRMPGALTGIDLARLVKQEWPSVQVLLTTGYVDGGDTLDGLELLYKPYRAADLAERLQSLLGPG